LEERDALRLRTIVDIMRKDDDLEDWGKPTVGIGPQNFFHKIEIKYHCRWIKEKALVELENPSHLASQQYPFLFKDTVHISEFKELLRQRYAPTEHVAHNGTPPGKGESLFFGFAMVNLTSSSQVERENPYVPPIFDKITMKAEDCQGYIGEMIPDVDKKRLFPKQENAFVYNAERYLATSEMLAYYDEKGLDFELEYFVNYYRGAPFKNFVNTVVRERINCMQRVDENGEADPDVAGANLYKLLANSAVGKFAQAVHRFTKTRIIGPDKLRKCFQDATFKNYKPLRSEDVLIDPLYEVCQTKKMVTENLALHIQIQVYQARDNLPFFF
jgi:hypothetical protein